MMCVRISSSALANSQYLAAVCSLARLLNISTRCVPGQRVRTQRGAYMGFLTEKKEKKGQSQRVVRTGES